MSEIYDPRFDPLPTNPVEYTHRLAHDLAWGVHNRKWKDSFYLQIDWNEDWRFSAENGEDNDKPLFEYLEKFWGKQLPNPKMLTRYGYLNETGKRGTGIEYWLTESALKLPEQKTPVPIFISYSRSQSSALALLLVARFKEHNMSPFLDMHPDREDLPLGSNWETQIKTQIQNSDSFIVLIGPQTLKSENVIKELNWAREFERKIIPMWHNINVPPQFSDSLSEELKAITDSKQGVIVEAENPKQYNAALDQLLAHFSIAP